MALIRVSVDVYCVATDDGEPAYRVYVDQDLLTERTWIWPTYEVYIKENIEVNLEPGVHQVSVEKIGTLGSFAVKNLIVDGVAQIQQDLSFNL